MRGRDKVALQMPFFWERPLRNIYNSELLCAFREIRRKIVIIKVRVYELLLDAI